MKIHYHNIRLRSNGVDKDFWQKVWLIERYTASIGFMKQPK